MGAKNICGKNCGQWKTLQKNSRAAPEFIVNVEEDFKQERARLSAYIYKTQRILI